MKKVRQARISLNEDQQRAVDWNDGPAVVSAGPGSGKSRVIVERICRLIQDDVCKPHEILATTFTRKAAEVMNSRLKAKRIDVSRMSVQTTHSFCFKLLRESKQFKAWSISENDQHRHILKQIVGYRGMKWNVDLADLEQFIAHCRNSLIAPDKAIAEAGNIHDDARYGEAFVTYDKEMSSRQLMTFDDMLYYGVTLLEKTPKLLDRIRRQYKYVLVDEFQDSNYAQITLFELVAFPEMNIMIVEDGDQAIYQWRGSMPSYTKEFHTKYQAELLTMGINYRCARKIVDHSVRCIEHDEVRLQKELTPARTQEGVIKFHSAFDTDDEARTVASNVEMLAIDGMNYSHIQVLMRTNAQSRAIEERFIEKKIPFVVLGAMSFYERKEVADMLAYMRVLKDKTDAASGERSVCRPFRYIGRRVLDDIHDNADEFGDYFEGARYVARVMAGSQAGRALTAYSNMMRKFNKHTTPVDALETIVAETKYIEYLRREEGSDTIDNNRSNNVYELIASAHRFKTIPDFLEHIDRQILLRKRHQRMTKQDRVQVMTIHKAKGTESTCVFLIGANAGIIPHEKSDYYEERRLFYVAMTRAKDILHVSSLQRHQGNSGYDGNISPFAFEAGIVPADINYSTETNQIG